VRHGDNNWGDIVRWSFYALVAAEEYGITKANLEEVAASTQNPEIRRLLGLEGDMGKKIGLDNDFAKRAILASGNYGEVFEANIGASTSIGLARGLNAQWTQGGLMYAPPFR
jgi:general L-amino acid transport system substrate-binding protein